MKTGPLVLFAVLASLGAAAFVLGSQTATASSGDGPAPGAPVHEVHVDPGALAGSATWVQRVEKGDTFGELAQRHLGTARRAADIQRLNPKVDPRALRVGQSLLLPPRKAGSRWVDLYVSAGGAAQPVGLGAPAQLGIGPVRVFAVPHGRLLVLRAAARGPEPTQDALLADPEVAVSEPLVLASGGPAIARATSRLEVTALAGRRLEVRVADQRLYGAKGHRLAAYAETESGGTLAVPLLLVLAGLIVFALVAIAARRMAAIPEDESRRA